MRVAVDVMGGDYGCGVVIEGVKKALENERTLTGVYLVGEEKAVRAAMDQVKLRDPRVHVVHASEVLGMNEKPVEGLRRKRDCSILKAVELVKEGICEAVISPGNTGGVVAASAIKLRPLPGVDRPAIATVIPSLNHYFVLLDSGANLDCKPINLVQYAIMGAVYAREILGYQNPRVGLLNVGTEDVKGTALLQEAFQLCKQTKLNFIGNVEGHDLFANRVDVVVCDGFVGNVVLKTCESLATGILTWLRHELSVNPKRMIGALLVRGALRALRRRMDPEAYGGAPLLGLNGNVMIMHGASKAKAMMNALRVTVETLRTRVNHLIAAEIQEAAERLAEVKRSAAAPVYA